MSDLSKSELNETRNYKKIIKKNEKKKNLRAAHENCYKSITNMLQKYHKRITKGYKKETKKKGKKIFLRTVYTQVTQIHEKNITKASQK